VSGIVASLFAADPPPVQDRDPGNDFWFGPVGKLGAAGMPVTRESALRLPVVVNCIAVIAQPVATLPLALFRRQPDGSRARLDDHPVARMLRRPNARQTACEFKATLQWDLAIWNNAYAEIISDGNGVIVELRPLPPPMVTVERTRVGAVRYRVRDELGRERVLAAQDVWHLRGQPLADDGLTGLPQIVTGREAISKALALQDFAARFFANDATPSGIVEYPGFFEGEESRNAFIRAWHAAFGGRSRHRTAVLEHGMTYKQVSVPNDKAQFIETMREAALDITRIWNVPPHKVGILDRATFSNIEQQALEFVADTLVPWLALWEQSIERTFLAPFDADLFVRFNVNGLLRGDTKSRFEAYASALQNGWLSVNEVRALEDMDAVVGGEAHLRPLNMEPIGTAPAAADRLNGGGDARNA